MALFLALETSSKNCSVAVFNNQDLVAIKEQYSDKYSHSESIIGFIRHVINSANISLTHIDAIVLSKGPGSYTGLRIGTSVAKGLCYSLNIPLISVSTLRSMAYSISKKIRSTFFCPMIDARRMEVFSAIYDENNKELRKVSAIIVDKYTYQDFSNNQIIFFGDGAKKCKSIIHNNHAQFIENVYPSARNLGFFAHRKFINNEFEDVAYFEPYYLKDFVSGT